MVQGADMNADSAPEVAAALDSVDLVVVRTEDYLANGLPLNTLQDELVGILDADPSFTRPATPGAPDGYAVFRGAGSR